MNSISPKSFPSYNPIGNEELQAACEVIRSGELSGFVAKHGESFMGGRFVQKLETLWAEYHQVKYAVAFNSATSGLIAALGAIEICPGDEVIVIGYSMCISATAPLFFDAVPVFVDIEEEYFCMNPEKIEASITPRTKAILPVDLFGQSSDMVRINALARKYDLKVLSDAAHVPGCRCDGGYAGTMGDIGVYSLNQHKIIHCGEGGITVTNDDELALRLQLIRNHAEAVVGDMGYTNLVNMLGGNYRLGEIEAAIAIEQLKKLPKLLDQRIELANYLTEKLSKLEFLTPPKVRENNEHVYYLFPLKYHEEETGISRRQYIQNIRKLGIPLFKLAEGYVKPFYLEPIFSQRDKLKNNYPYTLLPEDEQPIYEKGICPVQERLYEKEMIATSYNYPPLTTDDMDDIVKAFTRAARNQ